MESPSFTQKKNWNLHLRSPPYNNWWPQNPSKFHNHPTNFTWIIICVRNLFGSRENSTARNGKGKGKGGSFLSRLHISLELINYPFYMCLVELQNCWILNMVVGFFQRWDLCDGLCLFVIRKMCNFEFGFLGYFFFQR